MADWARLAFSSVVNSQSLQIFPLKEQMYWVSIPCQVCPPSFASLFTTEGYAEHSKQTYQQSQIYQFCGECPPTLQSTFSFQVAKKRMLKLRQTGRPGKKSNPAIVRCYFIRGSLYSLMIQFDVQRSAFVDIFLDALASQVPAWSQWVSQCHSRYEIRQSVFLSLVLSAADSRQRL